MKVQGLLISALLFAFAHFAQSFAQGVDDTALQRSASETLLSMPEPPVGYVVTKHPLTVGDELVGFQIQVVKEGAVSKVFIKVEMRDLSDRGRRVAACKAYVNGLASGLKNAGFTIADQQVPDIEKSNFKTPVVIDLTFKNEQGVRLLVQKRIFFTTKGYDVTVVATDENDLKLLTQWAAQIRPAGHARRQ